MNELGLVILILIAGLSVARLFLGARCAVFSALAAFPLGLSLWVFSYILVYCSPFPLASPLPFDLSLTLISFCLITIISLIIGGYRSKPALHEIMVYLLAFGLLSIVYSLNARFALFVTTGDSFAWLDINLGFQNSLQRGYPIFKQCVQALSLLIGVDYVWTITSQFMMISLAGMMTYVTFVELRECFQSASLLLKTYLFLLSGLPAALFFSTYLVFFMTFYHKHYPISAALLFVCASFTWIALRKKMPAALYPGIFALLAYTLTRMEGLVCATAILTILLNHPTMSRHQRRIGSLLYGCGATLWISYVIYLIWGKAGNSVSAAEYLILLIVTIGLMTLNARLIPWPLLDKILQRVYSLAPTALLVLFVGFLIAKSHYVLPHLVRPVALNLFWGYGGWNALWYFIVIALGVLSVVRYTTDSTLHPIDLLLSAGITTILLMLDVLSYRGGARVGLTNSLNRVMFYLVPLLLVWIVVQIGLLPIMKRNIAEDAQS